MRAAVLSLVLSLLASTAMAAPPVKLGVLTDLSGVYSDATGTGSIEAVKMAREGCLAGPCRGMTIDIISADHQNKPDIAHGAWDLYTHLDTIPGDQAFRPMDAALCPRIAPQ